MKGSPRRTFVAIAAFSLLLGVAVPITARTMVGASAATISAVPRAQCGPGSDPETGMQGRVSADDVASGRAARGYTCNTEVVSHESTAGGFRVQRYADKSGHVCAFYDSTLLFPTNALIGSTHKTGVFVLDMTDPAHPVQTAELVTPAMQSPHESLSLNVPRGLLAADLGNPFTYPGVVDIYSVADDCRHPALQSSLPIGAFGHEGAFSPDGRTFWVSAAGGGTLTAIDVSNPAAPVPLWIKTGVYVHGLNIGRNGNSLYYAALGYNGETPGLTILDVNEIQRRVPNPQVRTISHLTWHTVSLPQVPIPVKINGHRYLVEIDEFATSGGPLPSSDVNAKVGAARIIDIADESQPRVISNIRLEVNTPSGRAATINDPGANNPLQGYAGHYCAVPRRADPGIVACSFILSGLRVFDIRDPYHPKELAYFNAPVHPAPEGGPGSNYAMSAPAFDSQRGQIWYSDGNDGFYAVRVTNGAWPFPTFGGP
jgi:hypothetical protein